jgi:predicted metalloprotease with PDZ domain
VRLTRARSRVQIGVPVTAAPALALALALASPVSAQHPLASWTDAIEARFANAQPAIDYTLRVDPGDTSGFDVTMHIRNAADRFRVAMVAHPEYDDRYWRYVTGMRATSPTGRASVARADSAVWQVAAPGGDVVLHYRLALPPRPAVAAAYRPFIAPGGALVGGVYAFMYVVGATFAPAHVRLDIPADWQVATGLEPTVDPHVFFAPSAYVLVESPILLGRLRSWRFAVDGVPHRVAYWSAPGAQAFDTTAFVDGVRRIVEQAIRLFGRAPYRDYSFLFRDAAYGSLEHANSVTIGIPSADLARDPNAYVAEIAHEYFHAWNIIRIHPI